MHEEADRQAERDCISALPPSSSSSSSLLHPSHINLLIMTPRPRALTRIGAIALAFLFGSNGLSTDARKNSLRTRLLRVEIRGSCDQIGWPFRLICVAPWATPLPYYTLVIMLFDSRSRMISITPPAQGDMANEAGVFISFFLYYGFVELLAHTVNLCLEKEAHAITGLKSIPISIDSSSAF